MTATDDWKFLVATKQEQLTRCFPSQWHLNPEILKQYGVDGIDLINSDVLKRVEFFSQDELEITETFTATELVERLRDGSLSSIAVSTAFAKRAAISQQLTSCLTEIMFSEALERAKFLDDYLQRHGKPVGPLHGLPMSVKDSFNVKGKQATVGYVEFLKVSPADFNSPLVDLLLDLGAVILTKTNIPQTMMTGDSHNNIFGRTLNPHNTSLTAGGSSGGEGALVAFKGSPLGVGTDIAGSIRIPALCCGVYGFKPSSHRVPFGGQVSGAMEGLPGIIPSAGPLANSMEDLELFASTVLGTETYKYDATASGVPWNTSAAVLTKPRLTIGVLDEHHLFPLHPSVRRALEDAMQKLKQKGHQIVRVTQADGRDIAFGSRLAFQYFIYAPQTDHIAASGEPAVPSVAKAASPMFTGELPVSMDLGPFELINDLHMARDKYRDAWRKTWVDYKLDAVLAPAAQNTAVPHDTFGWPPYTVFLNLLDYPACIIPYGKASKHLDPEPQPPNNGVQPGYFPEAVHDAPCAIQVFAPRSQDERCLAMARIIDRDIRC